MYNNFIDKSFLFFGNNSKIKNAIQKSLNEEIVKIGYLGGSVTDFALNPENYSKFSFNFLNEKIFNNKAQLINAGLTGTTSTTSLLVAQDYLLPQSPDIIFLDFSINDTREKVSRDCFESIIRNILLSENSPAIIILLLLTKDKYCCYNNMKRLGEYYNLPVISIYDYVTYGMENNLISWEDYSSEYSHPNHCGHQLISNCILSFFEKIKISSFDEPYTIPTKSFEVSSYLNIKILNNKNKDLISANNFNPKSTKHPFEYGWIYDGKNQSNYLKFTLKCKNIIVIHQTSPEFSFGTAEIIIDNKKTVYLQGYNSTAWDNPVSTILFNNDVSEEHEIEIKMIDTDKDKKFVLLSFGYSI
jgi:acyl-CoA thioesterase-1